jgi:hypothetical protein
VSDSITRLNEKVDMNLSAVLVVAALILLFWLTARTANVTGLWLLPVAFLRCDLVQIQNILWAFQLAWAVVVLCLMISLWGLELGQHRRLPFFLAIVAGIVGSFSSLQGLLIWPVGLVYLLCLQPPPSRALTWLGAGITTSVVYFWNLGPLSEDNSLRELIHHPILAAHFYLRLLGGFAPSHASDVGALLLVGSLGLGWLGWQWSSDWRVLRVPLGLWLTAVLFDLVVTEGRLRFGLSYALSSRYTTYNLLLFIGVYVGAVAVLMPGHGWKQLATAVRSRPIAALAVGAVTIAVAFQLSSSIPNGLLQGQSYRSSREVAVQLLRHYKTTPDSTYGEYIYAPDGGPVKALAPILARDHLSVFS